MGLLSVLFGGSKTTVTQKATNTTNVDVSTQLQNIIDLTALADAVKAMGLSVQDAITSTGSQTQAILKSLTANQQVSILAYLADVQQRAQENALIQKTVQFGKFAALAGGVYFIWRKFT